MLTSPRMNATLSEIETSWSFDDLAMANEILDSLEDAEGRAYEQARRR